MVQTISSVSMFFETREVKSSSKVKDSGFDSFLETGKTESGTETATQKDDTMINAGKSSEAISRSSDAVSKKNAQSNVEEVQTPDNCEADYEVPEAEDVISDEYVVTEDTFSGKSNVLDLLVNESDDMVSLEETVDILLEGETEEVLPEEVLSEILTVLNQIVMVSQEVFQCTEEELFDAVQEMQFEVTDFFNPDQIRELFLQVRDADASELLTSEVLCETFMELQERIDDVLQNSNLAEILPEMNESPEMFDVSEYKEQIIDFIFEHETKIEFNAEVVNANESVVVQTLKSQETVQTSQVLQKQTEEGTEQELFVRTEESGLQVTETATSKDETMFDTEQNESNSNDMSSEPDSRFEHANTFISKLVAAVKNNASEPIAESTQAIDMYDIAMQVIEQVKLQVRPDTTKMEIQLNPEQLGKVEVEITSKNGELSAKLNVQNDQVKEAVEGQMQMLRETLELQGLKVENIEVTVAEFGFRFQDEAGSNQPQQQRQRRNGLMNIDETETEDSSFKDASEVMKELNGNSIDYVA